MRWIHPVVVNTYLIELSKKKAQQVEANAKAKEEQDSKEPSQTQIQDVVDPKDTKQDVKKTKKQRGQGTLSLKALTLEKLGRHIQLANQQRHDSLEDAIATRDLAHWKVLNKASEDVELKQML
jgi:RNA exonuclease 1